MYKKYIIIIIFTFLLLFSENISYAGINITGDRMLSDSKSKQSINGSYSGSSGEITLNKIENIAASTINGQGSCNSIQIALGNSIKQNLNLNYAYYTWYDIGVNGCIETDLNNDGNKEIIYSVHQKIDNYGGMSYKDTTYIVKQPNDPLLLYPRGGGYRPLSIYGDYTYISDRNTRTINGILTKRVFNNKTYFVTTVNTTYGNYYGGHMPYSYLGEIWGAQPSGTDIFFNKLAILNVVNLRETILGNQTYFLGYKPFYTVVAHSMYNTLRAENWIYNTNFTPLMKLGDNITQFVTPAEVGGFKDIINTKLGTSNWIITTEGSYLYIIDIFHKKKYKINGHSFSYGKTMSQTGSTFILFKTNATVPYQYGYVSQGSPGGILLLTKNITFDKTNLLINNYKEITGIPIGKWDTNYQGKITYLNSQTTIYGVGQNLIKFIDSPNPTISSLGRNNTGLRDCRYAACGVSSLKTINLKDYIIYDLQYIRYDYSRPRPTRADSHIYFTFRKSDKAYLGMKSFNVVRATRMSIYNGNNYGITTHGANLDDINNNIIKRTLATNSNRFVYNWGYKLFANPTTTVTFTPDNMILTIAN